LKCPPLPVQSCNWRHLIHLITCLLTSMFPGGAADRCRLSVWRRPTERGGCALMPRPLIPCHWLHRFYEEWGRNYTHVRSQIEVTDWFRKQILLWWI
jgi:hypothetical protein